MPEPIAVAYVEIRPEMGGFRSDTDREIRQTFDDPVDVPAEFQVANLDQARRDIDSALRDIDANAAVKVTPDTAGFQTALSDLDTAVVPISPDVRNFQSELDSALAAAVQQTPLEVPAQLQFEGLATAEQEAAQLQQTLQQVSAIPLTQNVGQLEQELQNTSAAAQTLVGGLAVAPADFTALSGGIADVGDAAGAASEHIEVLGNSAGSTTGQLRYGIEIGKAFSKEVDGATDAVKQQVVAQEDLGKAQKGLVQTGQNTFRMLDLTEDSLKRAGAATRSLTEAEKGLVLARKTERAATGNMGVAPATIQAEQRYARALQHSLEVGKTMEFQEDSLTRSKLAGAAATVEETAAEERQNRLRFRARRAAPIGPFRLAGVGLGIGAAVFAGAQAVGQLGEALAVTGEEANTFSGRMRNLGSSLLQFDIVGSFRALTQHTDNLSIAQLRAINTTADLTDHERELVKAAIGAEDIMKSQAAATELLAQPPQFLQTALSREELQGDTRGQARVVEKILADIEKRRKTIREIGLSQREVNALMETLNGQEKQFQDLLKDLLSGGGAQPFAAGITRAQDVGNLGKVVELLERRRDVYERDIAKAKASISDQAQLATELRVIQGQLQKVDHDIEEAMKAIFAEADRHALELLSAGPQQFLDQALLADVMGKSRQVQIRNLQAARALLVAQLTLLKIIDPDAWRAALNEIKAIDAQIEGIRGEITSEQQAHQTKLDAASDKQHQIYLNGLAREEQRIQNLLSRAASQNELLGDDIKFQKQLVAFYRKQAQNRKLTAEERARFRDQAVQAQNQLNNLNRQAANDGKDALRNAIDEREDKLRDQLRLAQLNDRSTKDDERALKRLIAFYRKQAHNMKLTAAERRKYMIKLRETQADLKDLGEEQKKTDNWARRTFDFMQTLQGFSTSLIGNLIPGFATGGLVSPTSSTTGIRRPDMGIVRATGIKAAQPALAGRDRPITTGQGNTQIFLLRDIRAELKKINRGDQHPEASRQRKKGAAAGDNSYQTSHGM